MVTILPALKQIRKDLVKLLDRKAVKRICRELDPVWRDRQLDPYTTLHLFILQVLNQNTAMTHLSHLTGEPVSASAYCQARQRLPLGLFERLSDLFSEGLQRSSDAEKWHGHRVMLVDGTGFSMPDTAEMRSYFGQPAGQKLGCGFPVAHLLVRMDAQTGFLHDVVVSPLRTHDMVHVADLHPKLSPGDIVLADRGFCSYVHLALLSQANAHAALRIHQRQIVSFVPHRPCAGEVAGTGLPTSRWIRRLGPDDQIVAWRKPDAPPAWMTSEEYASLPEELVVREIRRPVHAVGCRVREVTLVTTLLDAERYPADEVARLYKIRWQVEAYQSDCTSSALLYQLAA